MHSNLSNCFCVRRTDYQEFYFSIKLHAVTYIVKTIPKLIKGALCIHGKIYLDTPVLFVLCLHDMIVYIWAEYNNS